MTEWIKPATATDYALLTAVRKNERKTLRPGIYASRYKPWPIQPDLTTFWQL